MITREPIYLALYTLLQTISGFITISRRLKHWADVGQAEQPAIFIIQKNEVPIQARGIPTAWKLNLELYVYVNSGDDPAESPAKILNPLIDAIETLFPASDEDAPIQTLGGLVSHAWISGTIETSEGVLGQQEVAIIPIEVLTT
jgi:hypothetical protein